MKRLFTPTSTRRSIFTPHYRADWDIGNEFGAKSWAILTSLVQSANLGGLDPFMWLDDVLDRIVAGEVKNNALDQLLAWNWAPKANMPLLAAAA